MTEKGKKGYAMNCKINKYLKNAKTDALLVDINASTCISSEDHTPVHSGLRSVLAYLRKNGKNAEILFHLSLPWPSRKITGFFVREILRKKPLFLGFSPYQSDYGCVNYLRETGKIVKALNAKGIYPYVVLGGHFASFEHSKLITDCSWIDFIVRGEGEETFDELISVIKKNGDVRSVKGLTCRVGDNTFINAPRPAIKKLDHLPFPATDHLKFAKQNRISIPTCYINSSRGCYGNCSFCSIQSFYKLSPSERCWRPKSPEVVVDELETLSNKYNIEYFRFLDDNFIGYGRAGKVRAVAIAKEIIKRKLNIKFRIMCRTNDVDETVLKALKLAGLHSMAIGVESGSERGLKTYSKGVTSEQNKKAMRLISGLGILVIPAFIFLNPYSTIQELRDNIAFYNFTKSISNVAWAQECILTYLKVYSGTPIYKRMEADKMLFGNYIEGFDYVFKDKKMKFILDLCNLFENYAYAFERVILGNSNNVSEIQLHELFKFKRVVFCDIAVKTVEDMLKILENGQRSEIDIFVAKAEKQLKSAVNWAKTRLALL